nr:Low-density lipoprotein receptor-related 2 [Ipomoea batatas]
MMRLAGYWLKEGGRTLAAANRRRLRPYSGNRSPSDQNEQRDFVEESGKEGRANQRADCPPLPCLTSSNFVIRAEYKDQRRAGGSEFIVGFLLGGAIFGTLGYVFAPQIRRSLLNEDESGF